MSAPRVSVLIASYNYGPFIEDAINSVLAQTFPRADMEIVVVDDGSTDDTRARVARYGDAIRYVYKENGGQASAFNVGFAHCRGELIAFLDADDLWLPDKLAEVTRLFAEAPDVDVVVHDIDVVDGDGRIMARIPDRALRDPAFDPRPLASFLEGHLPFYPPTSGITVRRTCLANVIPFPAEFRVCADHYLYTVLPLYVRQARLVRRALTRLRLHGTNVWTGLPPTIPRLETWIRFHVVAWQHVERHCRALGYDSTRLKRRLDAVQRDDEIQLHVLRGERWRALGKALRFDDARPEASVRSRAVRRITRVAGVLLPPGTFHAFRERYRRSPLYRLVHRGEG